MCLNTVIKILLNLKDVESIAKLQNPNVKGESDVNYVLPFYRESGEWVISGGFSENEHSLVFTPHSLQNTEVASPANGYVDLVCEDTTYGQAYVKIIDSEGRNLIVSQLKTGTLKVSLGQKLVAGQYLGQMNGDEGQDNYGADGCYKEYSTAVGVNNAEIAQWRCKEAVIGRPCGRQSGPGIKVEYSDKVLNFENYKFDRSTVLSDTNKVKYDPNTLAYQSKLISQNMFENDVFKDLNYPGALINPIQYDKISGVETEFKIASNNIQPNTRTSLLPVKARMRYY